MATYYVRTDGSDGNAGTGSAAGSAWQTIGKALGAAGISSGDTVYIAPGTYRETVTVAMTSAVAETFVTGDVSASQFSDLQGGDVVWTAYTTNDRTVPATAVTLAIGTNDYLTFTNLIIVGGATSAIFTGASGFSNITFRYCTFIPSSRATQPITVTAAADAACNLLFDSCILNGLQQTFMQITLTRSAIADYDANITFKNCLMNGYASGFVNVTSTGASAFFGGGVNVFNCTLRSTASGALIVSATSVSSTFPFRVYNCMLLLCGVQAATLGQVVEDYNYFFGSTTHTSVTVGAHSVNDGATATYAPLLEYGQAGLNGRQPRQPFVPAPASPFLGFGSDGSIGVQTVDAFGVPRPSGGASALKAVGFSERGNTFSRETGTVHTGAAAVSITGPGVQDFQLPVNTASTTATVYVQWDATYAGTKPQMIVLNGEECGVATATSTATGASGSWEQLSLTFTATRVGIVTVRLKSNDTNGGGHMYADDFAVT